MRHATTSFRVKTIRMLLSSLAVPAMMMAGGPASAGTYAIEGGTSDAVRCFEAARSTGQPSQSDLNACDTAVTLGGMDARTHTATLANRAIVNGRLGRFDAAVADCEALLARSEPDADLAVTCAGAYIRAGQPADAIRLLSQSDMPAPPLRYKYYHNMALAHHDLGQYPEAYAYIEQTLSAKPDFAPARDLKEQYTVVQETSAQ